jgi:hypothetical protein
MPYSGEKGPPILHEDLNFKRDFQIDTIAFPLEKLSKYLTANVVKHSEGSPK